MAQTQSTHKDFLHYLMKQLENGSISQEEIIVNGALMMCVLLVSALGL